MRLERRLVGEQVIEAAIEPILVDLPSPLFFSGGP
jgi:hypothetical protein